MNSAYKYFYFQITVIFFVLAVSFPLKSFANVNSAAGQIVSTFGDVRVSSGP